MLFKWKRRKLTARYPLSGTKVVLACFINIIQTSGETVCSDVLFIPVCVNVIKSEENIFKKTKRNLCTINV